MTWRFHTGILIVVSYIRQMLEIAKSLLCAKRSMRIDFSQLPHLPVREISPSASAPRPTTPNEQPSNNI